MESRCAPSTSRKNFWPTPLSIVPVVVPDIWMPGVTGLEILARTCALTPRPRVIVITAFFIKPFNDEQFLAAVHDALAQAKNS
jgi:DNA-binding NtrC family response regulator